MFQVIQPPSEETKLAEVGKELMDAATRLGMKLDVEGFLLAWVGGTRVIVERDGTGTIVSLLLMTVGMQWNRNEITASILEMRGNKVGLIEFAKQMAAVMGAARLYVQVDDALPQVVARVIERVTSHAKIVDDAEAKEILDNVFKLNYPSQRLNGVLEFVLQ